MSCRVSLGCLLEILYGLFGVSFRVSLGFRVWGFICGRVSLGVSFRVSFNVSFKVSSGLYFGFLLGFHVGSL